jgi:hypothetical protein
MLRIALGLIAFLSLLAITSDADAQFGERHGMGQGGLVRPGGNASPFMPGNLGSRGGLNERGTRAGALRSGRQRSQDTSHARTAPTHREREATRNRTVHTSTSPDRRRRHTATMKIDGRRAKVVGKPDDIVHNPKRREGKLGRLHDHETLIVRKSDHFFRRSYYDVIIGRQVERYWWDEPVADSDPAIPPLAEVPICNSDSDDCSTPDEDLGGGGPPPPGPLDSDATPIHDTGWYSPPINRSGDPFSIDVKGYASGKKEVTYKLKGRGGNATTYPLNPVSDIEKDIVSGGKTIHIHLRTYGRTVEKPPEQPVNPAPPPPPTSVTGGSWFGRMTLFCVDDCDPVTFAQFVKQTIDSNNKPIITQPGFDWRWDTNNPDPNKAAPYPALADKKGAPTETGMYDAPGLFGPPKEDAINRGQVHTGDTYTITDNFETFVCCAGNWIGYWKWQVKLTYTWAKGASDFGAPAVEAPDPEWIEAAGNSDNFPKLLPQSMCHG